jgi:serine protease AprX
LGTVVSASTAVVTADAGSAHANQVNVTLSMAVKPGSPVPMRVVTEKSAGEYERKGWKGQGIDVALIDSGVSPVPGLDDGDEIIYGPDLSNEGSQPNLANLDTYGHGTHLAGIIIGDGGNSEGVFGIAPDSRIVSVKVAGATGETNIAQVIAGIDWVIEHKNDNGLNIRVLNLSLGIGGMQSSIGDPLAAAVERAWLAGIVVVAAAGNRGNASGVDSPATSPYVIAVGAIESYDSSGAMDALAPWSSGGNAIRTPDVVAAGRSIVSYRVPGSMLDVMNPGAVVNTDYFRGSGTSQSAAVVSGFVAALLSKMPSLTPDQVKYLFMSRADDLVPGSRVDGAGKIDPKQVARKVRDARNAPIQNFPLAIPATGVNGLGVPSGASWSGGTWNGASWSGGTWNGASWSGASWSGASWSGGTWNGASWSGATWSGASWSGASWSGASWSGASWSSAVWCGASWLGQVWE